MRIASLFKLSSAAFLSSVIGAATVLAISPAAQAKDQFFQDGFLSEVNWQVEPYIGADAMTRVMRYKNEPTHPFQEHLDTFQPFVGVRLHKYFGIEAGYQQSEKGTKERFFGPNDAPVFFGGGPMRLIDPTPPWNIRLDMNTTTEVKGWNVGVLGFYPIYKNKENKTELFAKIAYSDLSLNTEYRLQAVLADNQIINSGVMAQGYGHLHDSTGVFHFAFGVKQAFTHSLGGRAFIHFDRSARLKLDSRTEVPALLDAFNALGVGGLSVNRTDIINIRPHNSWTIGVGLFYNFFG